MEINLISEEQYNKLNEIVKNYPALTFQNNGYQYIDLKKLTDADMMARQEVIDILSKHIAGFAKFFNFKLDKDNRVQVRFDYKWDESFTGVGYLLLDELLNGFEKPNRSCEPPPIDDGRLA